METSSALSEAATYLSTSSSLAKLPNATKLELYGLYKFLTVDRAPQNSRPSLFDMTARAKWDAWSTTGKRYEGRIEDAERRYLDIAGELGWVPGTSIEPKTWIKGMPPGDVWDDELGVTVSSSVGPIGSGMGTSVSAITRPVVDDGKTETLHELAIRGDLVKISLFLAMRPLDVNQRDDFGYTALHLACDRGSLPVVKVLVQNGADPSLKDPDDLTVAELAQIAGHGDICEFLQKTSAIM
ncbi:ankyrin repeat-containing domain protein [Phlebopus sp. FC_14]|nr:ankyrin repeat-containing domain protein [Phlebopus sp. FC_14]